MWHLMLMVSFYFCAPVAQMIPLLPSRFVLIATQAFTNMTLSVRRALVATMVFAVVEKAGTVVMTQGEELDSWSVIINGHVEVSQTLRCLTLREI